MKRAIGVALSLLLVGCGEKTARFQPGQEVILYSEKKSEIATEVLGTLNEMHLPIGAKVMYLETLKLPPEYDAKIPPMARVRVLEGEFKDKIGLIEVAELRPLPK